MAGRSRPTLQGMAPQTLRLFSPFTPDECAQRLQQEVAPDNKLMSFRSREKFLGEIQPDHFRIKRNPDPLSGRAVLYEVSGTLKAETLRGRRGTPIEGQFGMDRLSRLSGVVVAVFCGLLFLLNLPARPFNLGEPFYPGDLLLAGIPFLRDFLADALQAEAVSASFAPRPER